MIIGYVKGQDFTLRQPTIASGTIDYLSATFVFSNSDWNECDEIWVHFAQGDKVYDAEIINGKVSKDEHINLSEGEWEVYLHGNVNVNGEVVERITTEKETLFVKESGIVDGNPFPSVEESTAEKILAKAQYAVKIAEGVREDFDNINTGGGTSCYKQIVSITNIRYSGMLNSSKITVFENPMERIVIHGFLNTSAENTIPEYVFLFESGHAGLPTRLSMTKDVQWANGDVPDIKYGYRYVIRIFDNIASYKEVEV